MIPAIRLQTKLNLLRDRKYVKILSLMLEYRMMKVREILFWRLKSNKFYKGTINQAHLKHENLNHMKFTRSLELLSWNRKKHYCRSLHTNTILRLCLYFKTKEKMNKWLRARFQLLRNLCQGRNKKKLEITAVKFVGNFLTLLTRERSINTNTIPKKENPNKKKQRNAMKPNVDYSKLILFKLN